jgi:hypothetical protein
LIPAEQHPPATVLMFIAVFLDESSRVAMIGHQTCQVQGITDVAWMTLRWCEQRPFWENSASGLEDFRPEGGHGSGMNVLLSMRCSRHTVTSQTAGFCALCAQSALTQSASLGVRKNMQCIPQERIIRGGRGEYILRASHAAPRPR